MAPRVFSVSDKSVGVSSASSPAEMKQKACNVLPGFTKKCKACTSQWTQQVVVSKVWKSAVLLTTSRNTTATTKKRSAACPHHTHNALLLHLGRAKAAVWAFSFYSFTLQFDSETTWLQFAIQVSESREKVHQLHHQKILLALSNYQIINFAHYILAFLTLVCINFTLGTLFKI